MKRFNTEAARCGYADASLNPAGGDWRKYESSYRIWGRLLYNAKADPDQWRRYLRSTFGPAASHAEIALSNASRVLPLLTTTHQPSASNLEYWVEVPPNMPMADGTTSAAARIACAELVDESSKKAERWQSAAMQREGQTYRAAILAAYTQSPFALQYYFHLAHDGAAGLYPGFNEVFANQPYFVVG